MDYVKAHSKLTCFLIGFVVAVVIVLLFVNVFIKSDLKDATYLDLDAIYGIKVTYVDGVTHYGEIATRIKEYITQNPSCKVEDLRIIKGVDDMIISQLKERFK